MTAPDYMNDLQKVRS